jgi:hypothetical protein
LKAANRLIDMTELTALFMLYKYNIEKKALYINTSTTPGLSFLDSPFFLSLEKDTVIIKISNKSERAQKAKSQ